MRACMYVYVVDVLYAAIHQFTPIQTCNQHASYSYYECETIVRKKRVRGNGKKVSYFRFIVVAGDDAGVKKCSQQCNKKKLASTQTHTHTHTYKRTAYTDAH